MGYYSVLQNTEKVLAQRAVAELRLGRREDAFADITLGFRLIKSIQNGPTLISGLVRITMMSILMQPAWEGIASHEWTDGQLTQLEELLQSTDFLADYEFTMRGERVWSDLMWDEIRSNPQAVDNLASSVGNLAGANFVGTVIRAIGKVMNVLPAISWQNELYHDRLFQDELLPMVDVKARLVDVRSARKLLAGPGGYNSYRLFTQIAIRVYPSIVRKYAMMQSYTDEARVACEIERYRRTHGSLPEKLEDLHMADLPHDVIDGKPLRYSVKGTDDYRLYSIGWNETDDGGVVGRQENGRAPNSDKGDWVWSLKPL